MWTCHAIGQTPATEAVTPDRIRTDGPSAQVPHGATGQLPEVVLVESEESKDRKAIKQQVQSLLGANDYTALDKLAADLRTSKAAYVDGYWKLWACYKAFGDFPKQAPEDLWSSRLSQLREWMRTRPNSVTARIALADALTAYAWHARGGGYADTVTENGWKLFHERLTESLEILKQARALAENCPHWFAVAQQIALGENWPREDYEKLFGDAIKGEPTYASFYFRKVLYLMPRWHGEEGEWEKFASEAADRIGGEDGDILYSRICWFVHDLGFYKNVFRETQINGNRVRRGYQLMRTRYPNSITVTAQFARVAVLNGDPFQTRALLDQLGGHVDLDIWSSEEFFRKVQDWAYGSRGAGGVANAHPRPAESAATEATLATAQLNGAKAPAKRELTLDGFIGRLAIVNGQSLGVGEVARIQLGDSQVKVRCEEILTNSVIVTIDGQPGRKELHLRSTK